MSQLKSKSSKQPSSQKSKVLPSGSEGAETVSNRAVSNIVKGVRSDLASSTYSYRVNKYSVADREAKANINSNSFLNKYEDCGNNSARYT